MTNTLTIACDMAYELDQARLGPRWDNDGYAFDAAVTAEDYAVADAIAAAQQKLAEDAYLLWAEAAERIGAEHGYEVTTVAAEYGSPEAFHSDSSEVARRIWQTAHDCVTVELVWIARSVVTVAQ